MAVGREKPWGLLGGSFDPPHAGHLALAHGALATMPLSGVRWMPTGDPPHRPPLRAAGVHRLAMAKILTQDDPRFVVDDFEITTPGPHYTIHTLQHLRATSVATTVLLMGADAFAHLSEWRRWQELFSYAHIAVASRSNHPPPATAAYPPALREEITARAAEPQTLRTSPAGALCFFAIESPPVSATQLRQQLPTAEVCPPFLPAAVWRYIKQHDLY